jgi:hypothetical protein
MMDILICGVITYSMAMLCIIGVKNEHLHLKI